MIYFSNSSEDEGEETLWNILECLSYRYRFDLNLANRAFLDLTWELPEFKTFELVPVTDLGLMIAVIKGHIIVSQVKQYSVAGEDHKVSSDRKLGLHLFIEKNQ